MEWVRGGAAPSLEWPRTAFTVSEAHTQPLASRNHIWSRLMQELLGHSSVSASATVTATRSTSASRLLSVLSDCSSDGGQRDTPQKVLTVSVRAARSSLCFFSHSEMDAVNSLVSCVQWTCKWRGLACSASANVDATNDGVSVTRRKLQTPGNANDVSVIQGHSASGSVHPAAAVTHVVLACQWQLVHVTGQALKNS